MESVQCHDFSPRCPILRPNIHRSWSSLCEVMWHHQPCNHLIPITHVPFPRWPIVTVYMYSHLPGNAPHSFLGPRSWPFKVTWRHRSRDQLIHHIGCPLDPSLYLLLFWDIWPQKPVRAHTYRHMMQVILYSVPCNVLYWSDNNGAGIL